VKLRSHTLSARALFIRVDICMYKIVLNIGPLNKDIL